MKSNILLLLLFTSLSVFAQPTSHEENYCIEKCQHANQFGKNQQVTYLQYSSMNKYDIKYLKLDISAETASLVIAGTALTVAKVVAPLDSFITELRNNLTVDSVYINGVKKIFTHTADHIFVTLTPALPVGATVSAEIFYRGTANGNGVFAGTVGSNGLSYVATLSESYQAREWFPAKQFLQDKIDSADIWITTSSINKAGSNGLLQGIDALPNGKSRYRWKTRYPMNYYLPSFAIGNYMEYVHYAKPVEMAPDSILVQHYLVDNPTYFTSVKTNLDKTPPFVEKMSELFGLYPFKDEKYGHAHASIGGGMEHQTMSTMNSFGTSLIAHELGHQWFGDNVTCATWNDIWLNEGFASYSEYLMVQNLPALFPTTNPAAYMQSVHNSVLSSPTGSVYVPDASIYDEGRIFSGRLSYNKGSAIIHTMRFEMQNDALFFQTLKNFQQQYKDSVASAQDFKAVAEATSGKNLTNFFNQWYYGQGYPTFNITYFKPTPDSLLLLVNETVSSPGTTPFFNGLLELYITSEQGDTTVLLNLAANNQIFKFKTVKNPTGIVVDPNNWILNQTGIITNGIVVPVTYTKLTVSSSTDCAYTLQWETAQETDVDRYEIEASNDATLFFKTGTILAKNGNSNNYAFTTAGSNGNILYVRLKMIEKNGGFAYSQILTVSPNCQPAIQVSMYPNPVKENCTLLIEVAGQTRATIKLINVYGQEMRSQQTLLQSGRNNLYWKNLGQLASGTYLLQVQLEDGKIITEKFVKQ